MPSKKTKKSSKATADADDGAATTATGAAPASADGLRILVTGASGYVAGHVIEQLLQSDKNYRVRGTVRSLTVKPERYAFLQELNKTGDASRLELVAAEIGADGAQEAFDAAVAGCDVVIHVASPYAINVADPQRDLVDPAVQGTVTVLDSCRRTRSVKTVVLTSSCAAITDAPETGVAYNEDDWNEKSSLTRNPYYYSKVMAERAAWRFVKEEHVDCAFKLVVINPIIVIGPEHNPAAVNTSTSMLKDMLTGGYPVIMSLAWNFVDVRDVARAHLLAFEKPEAEGRYVLSAGNRTMEQTIAFLRENGYAKYNLPSLRLNNSVGDCVMRLGALFQPAGTKSFLQTNLGRYGTFDNAKSRELGIDYMSIDQSMLDTVEDLIKRGHMERIPGTGPRPSQDSADQDGEDS